MHRRSLAFYVIAFCAQSLAPSSVFAQTAGPGDIVLHPSRASVVSGAWRAVTDTTAAGGSRIGTPNAGAAKIAPALAAPADYIELTFAAEAGRPYRIWVRGRAENNYWGNDSLHVQFSDSVTSAGSPAMRIGTTSSAEVSIEDGVNAGLSGWGWQDNGYGTMGPLIYFATTGAKTMRVQKREDGLWIDQIMLSPDQFLSAAPGAAKNDDTRFPHDDGTGNEPTPPPPADSTEVVLYASTAEIAGVGWTVVPDATAAGGAAITSPDAGAPKIETAFANPPSYFELTFDAEANVPHHLWIRGKARNNYWGNDSVHVQFSDSVTQTGAPIHRIGTTSAAWVNLENCSGCGISGWGWQDNGYGGMGPPIYFATSGTHTMRVQSREDGFTIDQIVVSSSRYLNSAPGGLKNDATILPESSAGTPPNQPPAVTLSAPVNGATYTAPAAVSIAASASDPENRLVDVRFFAGTALLGTDTTAPYSFTWSSVPAGSYSITAVARDSEGGTATSGAVGITVTTAAPAPWWVAFTASADHHSTVTNYRLEVFASGADPNTATPVASSDLGKPAPDSNGGISVERTSFFEALAAGNYVMTVSAVGSGGIGRSPPYTFSR